MTLPPTCCVCWNVTNLESKPSYAHFLGRDCLLHTLAEEISEEIKEKHEI